MSGSNIRVVCRLRPLNALEMSKGGQLCVTFTPNSIKLKCANEEGVAEGTHDFAFDRIFGAETSQPQVFQEVAIPVIDNVFKGYNGTVFAYGQTSSGKTFTMEGPSLDSEDMKGLIPRMFDKVFELIVNAAETLEFTVKVSFLEIYNEKIQDLLDRIALYSLLFEKFLLARKNNLQIKEDKVKGIFVQDATEVYVSSPEQMVAVMKTGAENRSIAATRMNERSSRSHSIFILYLIQRDTKTDAKKISKLYFVDLAGSEKISKTGASGQTLEEAKKINQSLTTLGMVINALTSEKKEHVPFRDSKLTRILQESLGGNSTTTLLIACSMCSYNDKETLSTLRFGNRAKSIKNKPIVNVERSVKELEGLLDEAEKKIKKQEQIIALLKMKCDNPSGVVITEGLNEGSPKKIVELDEKVEDIATPPPAQEQQAQGVEEEKIPDAESQALSPKPQSDRRPAGLPPLPPSSTNSKASANLLKQHIQIASLNEELAKMKAERRDLESELNARSSEVFELQEKGQHAEEYYKSIILKQSSFLHQFQIYYEKGIIANQELLHNLQKVRRDFANLKSDLVQLAASDLLSPSPTQAFFQNGTENIPESEQTVAVDSIKRALNEIDRLDLYLSEQAEAGLDKMTLTLSEDLLKPPDFSQLARESTGLNTSEVMSPRGAGPKGLRSNRSSRTGLMGAGPGAGGEKAEVLSTETDDDVLSALRGEDAGPTNSGRGSGRVSRDPLEQIDKEIMEEDSQMVMEVIMSNNISQEEKFNELQKLVGVQRRSIVNLNKSYAELSAQYDKMQAALEKKNTEYKRQMSSMNSNLTANIKDFEVKIEAIEALNQKLLLENSALHQANEVFKNEIESKSEELEELKLAGNRNANQGSPSQHALQSQHTGRDSPDSKAYYSRELIRLRRELEDKEEKISDKDAQISMMKINIDVLTQKLEALEKFKETQSEIASIKSKETAAGGTSTIAEGVSKLRFWSKDTTKKNTVNDQIMRKMLVDKKKTAAANASKESLAFFDKNVIKPIRGGGGDIKNYEKQNFMYEESKEGLNAPITIQGGGGKSKVPALGLGAMKAGEGGQQGGARRPSGDGEDDQVFSPRMEMVKQFYSNMQAKQQENLITGDDVVSESFRNDFRQMIYDENVQAVEKKFLDLGARGKESNPTPKNPVQSLIKGFKSIFS